MPASASTRRLVLPTFPPTSSRAANAPRLTWAAAIDATNNRHILETGASMFTDGDLGYARAIREQVETGHGPAFTMLPYFWQLMMRAVTSEFYLPGAVPGHLYRACDIRRTIP